jgi:hypothetical protein
MGTSLFSGHQDLPFFISGLIMILPLWIIYKLKDSF